MQNGGTMLTTLAISGYRSIRDLVVPLGRLNCVTGANGSGKSSLYRALRLLAHTSRGQLVASLAREGGLRSTLWAGPETLSREMKSGHRPVQGTVRNDPVHLRLGFASDNLGYAIELGFPVPGASAFSLDPAIKRESIWAGPVYRQSSQLVERRGPVLRAVDENGVLRIIPHAVPAFDSMISEFSDPGSAPEMIAVREAIRSWRFYDHIRTDAGAPTRLPQVGTHTPVLSDDGSDVAAALQTIREIGDGASLDRAIEDAFPGAVVQIVDNDGHFEVVMRQHGLLRPLKASELSDGTLRYLVLTAALLTPRPPELFILNEPETSLHPDLMPALARLIAAASQHSQVIVVSHNPALISHLCGERDARALKLEKELGETKLAGISRLDAPPWHWPNR
jgi:predicted ATPase